MHSNVLKTQEDIITCLLNNRGLDTPQKYNAFFNPQHPRTISIQELEIDEQHLDAAIKRLHEAKESKQTVVIYGDYDADGISATAVVWHGLALFGISSIPFIPLREVHGYGISKIGIDEIIEKYAPNLIITVDNGIVAHKPAEYISSKGIDLIITDHHQTDTSIPKADAIIHSDKVCGTTVGWILIRELLRNHSGATHKVDQLLDLVAIGTIADMMPMIGINRQCAVHGLAQLTVSQRPGIQALKEASGIEAGTEITSYHVGFLLGPRINAMGRIDHGLDALKLLCTNKSDRAQELAAILDTVNQDRQNITQDSLDLAINLYESNKELQNENVIVLSHQDFHEGVIGLVAGRLVEKYHKPAIVIAVGAEKSKGSARSVKNVNIIELIRSCESLLLGAGGHPGAAGLSLESVRIAEFTDFFVEQSRSIEPESLEMKSIVEAEIDFNLVSLELYQKIKEFAPFGVSNPRPLFSSTVNAIHQTVIGKEGRHLKLQFKHEQDGRIDGLAFGMAESCRELDISHPISIEFTIDENTWRGKTKVQVIVKSLIK